MCELLKTHPSWIERPSGTVNEEEIYENAVPLLIRDHTVLIRSSLDKMDRVFAADALLQRLLPKERIQFTGTHLEEVRKEVRRHGESWRISPTPQSTREIIHYIRSSRVQVGAGTVFYHNVPTGGRFLTFEEFMRIRPLLRSDPQEALVRFKEIVQLTQWVNEQGARELSFLVKAGRVLHTDKLQQLIHLLERCSGREVEKAEALFDRFAQEFALAAGPELLVDDENCVAWRTALFCRLYDIQEEAVEEWTLGLSPEFHLNVRWLPGARLVDGEPLFESVAETRVRQLITHFCRTRADLVSINVGRVESSQTQRDSTGEKREVYLVVLGFEDDEEEIRLLRMIKWDVMHRLDRGLSKDQAIQETKAYRDYIFDRLQAAEELGIPIPDFSQIKLEQNIPGIGTVPVYFFERHYVQGMVTDKIPPGLYQCPGCLVRLGTLLGVAAAVSMVLGRANPRSGRVFFDDGDEVIQFSRQGLPEKMVVVETTGSFTDWTTPLEEMLPRYLKRLAQHLSKARNNKAAPTEITESVNAFGRSLTAEIRRMQEVLAKSRPHLRSLFMHHADEPGSIRRRWEGILDRLETADTAELLACVAQSPELNVFRN
jgi:hypothetical protein